VNGITWNYRHGHYALVLLFFFFFKERGNIDSYNLDQSMRSEAVFMLSKRENSNNLTSSQEFMYEVGGMAPAVVCLASTKP
jgi:hypothetical protein